MVVFNSRKLVTTKTYFDFSNKVSFGGLKQFMYGNTFTVLDAFWVSLSNLFFSSLSSLSSSIFRVDSDKETSLVVVEKQNTIDSSVVESSRFLVSISKRCEFYSDKSITGFVEEPKAVCFIFHGYSAFVQEKKMLTFSDDDDDSNTSSMVMEKPFTVETKLVKSQSAEVFLIKEHVKEEMLVFEFMRCGVFKELLAHENFACVEENLFDDDDGFIELNPSLQISNISYEEEEEEEFMKREEEEVYDDDDIDDDDDDEFEHSDVIERLKTEIKTARTGGLCTILEESETPLEELKPLKIEPKPDQFKDRIAEIHKVYKNYAVKMRKLDVIDSQTMHSISKLN